MNDAHVRMAEVFKANEPEPLYVPPTWTPKGVRLRRYEGPHKPRT